MAAVDHLHQETNVLPITNHAELLAAQYLAKCLDDDHPCHYITRRPPPPRAMKETLHSKYGNLGQQQQLQQQQPTSKQVAKALHTTIVAKTIDSLRPNVILGGCPPPIDKSEKQLSRHQRTTLAQLRSGHCRLLHSYQHRLKPAASNTCPDCGIGPHDVHHLFHCAAHPITLQPIDLWKNTVKAADFLTFLLD